MTIKDFIIEGTTSALIERWKTLKNMDAPEVMIQSCEEELKRLANHELKCGGEVKLLNEEYLSHVEKIGRGGITYYVFNGNINYFPRARYGRFVVKGEMFRDSI